MAQKKKAGQGRPGSQHFVTTFMQEESCSWSESEEPAADRVHWRNMLLIVLRRDQRKVKVKVKVNLDLY